MGGTWNRNGRMINMRRILIGNVAYKFVGVDGRGVYRNMNSYGDAT
jgi:hypothetical protein